MIVRCPKHAQRFPAVIKHGPLAGSRHIDCPYCGRGYYWDASQNLWISDRSLYVHSNEDIYVAIFHKRSSNFYTLNRSYVCNDGVVPINWADLFLFAKTFGVERSLQFRQASFSYPSWADQFPPVEFDTYWLY